MPEHSITPVTAECASDEPKLNPAPKSDAVRFYDFYSKILTELRERTRHGIDENGTSLSDSARSEAQLLWRQFPYLLYTIKKPGNFDPARHAELELLIHYVHQAALEYLWFLAAKHGINDLAIREAGHLCQELMQRDFARFYSPPTGEVAFWPNCLGDTYFQLPGHQRQVIDDGQKAFLELAAMRPDATKAEQAEGKGTAGVVDKQQQDEWTTANGPTQWAKLFGISPTTLKRRFHDGKIRHKKLSAKSYQIAIDDLPAKHKEKFRDAKK